MAHRITAPAMQRAQRLLEQRVLPFVQTDAVDFTVSATDEFFDADEAHRYEPTAPFVIGSKWGKAWHTRWFTLIIEVPDSHHGKPIAAYIDLGFTGRGDGFQVEALAWRDGKIVHAIQPDRRLLHLGNGVAGERIEIQIEAAATPIIAGHEFGFGPTPYGDPATSPTNPLYTFRSAHLVVFHQNVNDLAIALHSVINLTLDLDETSPQRARLFAALDDCAQHLDIHRVIETATDAQRALDSVLRMGNGPSAHTIVATGHAHLDTAWLWPIRETRRKAVRTFANAVHLLQQNPDMVYCHSQAQHYAWVKEDAPDIFEQVVQLVREGRWEPVGGMWVETDLNLPSGESLLRQIVHGQRSFQKWFGITCDGAFLPDDFGYPGSLPQVVAHGGCEWFFTQKLSWNETNQVPHHTFWWEGIDGTQVFTHFSPIDTYNALMLPSQLRFAEQNYKDHVGSTMSLALYGHGDGGGGPTQAMIDRSRLAADWEGIPRVRFGTVHQFFHEAREEYGSSAPRWVGEMYFEKHRGTYSSQVGTKQGNRCSERLLHELEVWSAAAGVRPSQIDELWQRVLTQQFHDIIPGSSIAWVHDDAEREHEAVAKEIEALLARIIPVTDGEMHILNPAPVSRVGVIDVDGDARWVDAQHFSSAPLSDSLPHGITHVEVRNTDDGWHIANGLISIGITTNGVLTSIELNGRNLLPPDVPARFTLRRDTPAEYDAWDIDMADANAPVDTVLQATETALIESGPLRAVVESVMATDTSRFTVRYTLCAGSDMVGISLDADWHESEKRLQWQLPTDLRSLQATCGTQFGHVQRARHSNTSWDVARFEVCAHRYVAVAEPTFGAALLSDGPHGYDIRGDDIKLTLLRAPKFPDPDADRGLQHMEWSVMVTPGHPLLHGLEHEGALMAHPYRIVDGAPSVSDIDINVDIDGVLVSALKPADDGSGDLIVRLWETLGSRTSGSVTSHTFTQFSRCDALEKPIADSVNFTHESASIEMRPFEIVTLRLAKL